MNLWGTFMLHLPGYGAANDFSGSPLKMPASDFFQASSPSVWSETRRLCTLTLGSQIFSALEISLSQNICTHRQLRVHNKSRPSNFPWSFVSGSLSLKIAMSHVWRLQELFIERSTLLVMDSSLVIYCTLYKPISLAPKGSASEIDDTRMQAACCLLGSKGLHTSHASQLALLMAPSSRFSCPQD